MRITNKQRIVLGIIIIGLIFLFGYYYVIFCRNELSSSELSCSTAQKLLPFVDAVPLIIFIAFLAGAVVVFFLLRPKDEPTAFNKATLKFLEGDEKVIVNRLIEKNGEALQSELTLLEGMTKLKSHRAIRRLQKKGVVDILPKGKTNLVKLNGDLYEKR